jgi:REP element-mobilizing transposase RayT
MTDEPYVLDDARRRVVLAACLCHASFRGWQILAAYVRTHHVHLVVRGDAEPERMMTEFKAYAARALNEAGKDGPDRKRWARHGSTRHLYSDEAVENAVRYTVEDQGEPMSVYRLDGSP